MKKIISIFSIFIFSLEFFGCNHQIDFNQSLSNHLLTITRDLKTSPTVVTLSSAIQLAQKFLQSKNRNKQISIKSAETVIKDGVPYMHIINTNDNAGYAIISADSIYVPILSFDSLGNFSKEHLNTGLLRWFNKQGIELFYLRNHKSIYIDSISRVNKALWVSLGNQYNLKPNNVIFPSNVSGNSTQNRLMGIGDQTTVITYGNSSTIYEGPLCNTYWDQNFPYNEYCPSGNPAGGFGGHDPAGCVPVAMAQIMHFWGQPQNNYNFSIMPLSAQQAAANPNIAYAVNPGPWHEISRLLSDIGTTTGPIFISGINNGIFQTSQFAYYQPIVTSCNPYFCQYVFNVFGYSSVTQTETISDQIIYGDAEGTTYSSLLVNEILNNHRPCLVSGYPDKGNLSFALYPFGFLISDPSGTGHTWVCDGVQQYNLQIILTTTTETDAAMIEPDVNVTIINSSMTFLHMNWGQGGTDDIDNGNYPYNNGWYDCNINYTQADPGQPNYQYFQTITYNIHL